MKYSLRTLLIAAILVPPLLAGVFLAARSFPFGFKNPYILFAWGTMLLVAITLIATAFYQAVNHRS